MKHLFISIFIASLSYSRFVETTSYSASLNKLFDEVISNIKKSATKIDIEPLAIPDIHEEKEKNEFDLRNGKVSNIISVERYGDAEVSHDSGILKVKTGFKFTNLKADFNFNAKVYGLNPDGNVSALIPDLAATIELSVDAIKINATLEEVLVPSVGDIQVEVKTTAPIYGEIMDAVIALFTQLFQDEIIYIIGKVMKEKVNEFIQGILKVY